MRTAVQPFILWRNKILGQKGKWVASFAMLFLFYSLCAAYIAGGGAQFGDRLTEWFWSGYFGLHFYHHIHAYRNNGCDGWHRNGRQGKPSAVWSKDGDHDCSIVIPSAKRNRILLTEHAN